MDEPASAEEIRANFDAVLDDVLLPTGRVRFLGSHEHVPAPGGPRLVHRGTGEETEVVVRRVVVDATYREGRVPSRHTPSFAGIRCTCPRPVFEPGRVTVQPVRTCLPTFNAALVGHVEATRDDDAENRLCPPNPYPPPRTTGCAGSPPRCPRSGRGARHRPSVRGWPAPA